MYELDYKVNRPYNTNSNPEIQKHKEKQNYTWNI